MRVTILTIILLAIAAPIAHAASPAGHDLIAFVHKHHPSVTVPANASAPVQNAARELAATISEITSITVPMIVSKSNYPYGRSDRRAGWVVGASYGYVVSNVGFIPTPSPEYVAEDQQHDAYRVDGGNAVVTIFSGVSDCATIYAVYDYEENVLGVRWYAPGVTYIPHPAHLMLPMTGIEGSAAFAYRDTDIFAAQSDAEWDAHLHLSGNSTPDMKDFGGKYAFFNGAENFYGLVPPSTYFATHPEYFSLIHGQRSAAEGSQLCLTNPDVFKLVVDGLVAQAKADPSLTVLGLSPNDARGGWCTCDNCAAADAKFGGPSGTELDFVNRVAAAVQDKLGARKIWVETLAYLYTETPPTGDAVKPASNVIVLWAPLHADVGHGLETGPANAAHRDKLLGWAHIVAAANKPAQPEGWHPGAQVQLQVWHYAANFSYYLQPLPDWDELAADMKYYRAQGVDGMFVEGDYSSPGEMGLLRTYVVGHLMWNPNQDVWKLIADFCHGYYGPGGDRVLNYLRIMSAAPLADPSMKVGIYDEPDKAAYLTPAICAAADAALNPPGALPLPAPYQDRVDEAGLGLREIELGRTLPTTATSAADRAAYRARFDAFAADLHRFHVTQVGEQYSTQAYIDDMNKAIGAPAAAN